MRQFSLFKGLVGSQVKDRSIATEACEEKAARPHGGFERGRDGSTVSMRRQSCRGGAESRVFGHFLVRHPPLPFAAATSLIWQTSTRRRASRRMYHLMLNWNGEGSSLKGSYPGKRHWLAEAPLRHHLAVPINVHRHLKNMNNIDGSSRACLVSA